MTKPRASARAMRRDNAIEKHRGTISELPEALEVLAEKFREQYINTFSRIQSDLLILSRYVIDLETADSDSARHHLNKSLMGFIRELGNRYPPISVFDEVPSGLRYLNRNLDDLLVWLEVDTDRVRSNAKQIAEGLKIRYDMSNPLWVQEVYEARERIWKEKADRAKGEGS